MVSVQNSLLYYKLKYTLELFIIVEISISSKLHFIKLPQELLFFDKIWPPMQKLFFKGVFSKSLNPTFGKKL